MESRGAEVGEEKNKGKGREGKGREDEKVTYVGFLCVSGATHVSGTHHMYIASLDSPNLQQWLLLPFTDEGASQAQR